MKKQVIITERTYIKWNVCNKPESEELATEERDKMNLQTHC